MTIYRMVWGVSYEPLQEPLQLRLLSLSRQKLDILFERFPELALPYAEDGNKSICLSNTV